MTSDTVSQTDASAIDSVLSGEKDLEYRQGYVVVSTRRFQDILNERDRLLAEARSEVAKAKEEARDAESVLKNLFDQRRLTRAQIDDEISSAVAGYLRTSRSGGMDADDADRIQAVIDRMLQLGIMADIVNRRFGHPDDILKSVLREVEAECVRQRTLEGWSAENDDSYPGGRLAAAAGCYALQAADTLAGRPAPEGEVPRAWTLDPAAWKPKDARRDLVRALALGAAELSRMQRQEDAQADSSAEQSPDAWLRDHRRRISREAALHPDCFFYSREMMKEVNGILRKAPLSEPDETGGETMSALGQAALSLCIASHHALRRGSEVKVPLRGTTEHGEDRGDFDVTIKRAG
ncbi:hypothetical protein [Roseivivax sp. CAU 1761]